MKEAVFEVVLEKGNGVVRGWGARGEKALELGVKRAVVQRGGNREVRRGDHDVRGATVER